MMKFTLGQRVLSPGCPPYIIAEVGVNHNGDLTLAKRTIAAAAKAGADAVKFQTFTTDEFMASKDVMYAYTACDGHQSHEAMYAMFKRLELPKSWHHELQAYAHAHRIEFLSSAADQAAVDLLIDLDVPVLKIASEDLINLPLLEYIAEKKMPVILSTGMADQTEIDRAFSILTKGCPALLLLHCVSLYPTPDEEAHLLRMVSLQHHYHSLVGFSDHTLGNEAALAATALGAVVIEKHFTLDKSLHGPDHALSADPQELELLVRNVQRVAKQLGSPELTPSPGELIARQQFRRSVVAAIDIPEGVFLTPEMLCLKRPGDGIPPHKLTMLVGKQTRRHFKKNEQIQWNEVSSGDIHQD